MSPCALRRKVAACALGATRAACRARRAKMALIEAGANSVKSYIMQCGISSLVRAGGVPGRAAAGWRDVGASRKNNVSRVLML